MKNLIVFVLRLIGGFIVISAIFFVFDTINDRNTEIIVSVIGLMYGFIFHVSGRLQYFGLAVFTFFGRTTAYVRKEPYDQILRDEIGLEPISRHLYLNVIFAAIIELLCLFRLFSSLLGSGWNLLSDPINHIVKMVYA